MKTFELLSIQKFPVRPINYKFDLDKTVHIC